MKLSFARLFKKFGFVAESPAAAIPSENTKRHLDIINAPTGVPKYIEWDLNDPKSMAQAQSIIEKLQAGSRSFFIEDGPGALGKHIDKPDLKEDMVSVPLVVAG